jgi:hypothetical protein
MRATPNKRKLTSTMVSRLRPAARPYLVWDDYQRGLAMQIQPSGYRSYKLIYRFHNRPRWYHIGALRDSPHVNDKVKLSEEEIQNLSPMRRPIVNKPLGIAYGTGELPAMIASSRDYHAYRSKGHVPGDLIPIANTNHFTILDELRQPNSTLTRAVIAMAEYQTA